MEKLRYGLIGFSQSYYATLYTRLIGRRDDVDIVGVCDLGRSADYVRECIGETAEEYSEKIGVPLHHKLEDLLEQTPDIVLVTSEVAEHCEHTLQCLEAGCQVFVGKPLTFKTSDVLLVKEKAAATGGIVLPGLPSRYDAGLADVERRVRRGEIGRPIMCRVFVNHVAMIRPVAPCWEEDPARSGGPWGEFGTYCCDIAQWIMGDVADEMFAYGGNYLSPPIEDPDNIKVLAKMQSGALVSMDMCCAIRWDYPFLDVEVIGETGALRRDQSITALTERDHDPTYSELNDKELASFVAIVKGEEKQQITLEDAEMTVRMQEAVARSLQTGQPAKVER